MTRHTSTSELKHAGRRLLPSRRWLTARKLIPSALFTAAMLLMLVCASSASATTFTVNSTGDGGDKKTNGVCETNTRNECTLRAAIEEANATTAGAPHTIAFNIPITSSGYNSATGVWTIIPATALPAITRSSTTIDATTQTTNVGNTNAGTLGVGGAVGVDNLSLSTVNRPEIALVDNTGVAIGFDIQASNVTIRGFAIYGFGTAANNDASANIRIGGGFTGALIEMNVLGSSATSFTDPGAGVRSIGDNIRSVGADNGTVRNNLVGFSEGKGFGVESASTGWLIENNEFRGNGINNSNLDGVDIENSSGIVTVRGNLFTRNEGVGVDSYQSAGGNTIVNNTVTYNGTGPGGNVETMGVRLYGIGSTVDRNVVANNFGAGVAVVSTSTGNTITRNSIYSNGATTSQVGIDLMSLTDDVTRGTTPFKTINDAGDFDVGGNNLFNFPVITNAILSGGNLTLTGYARSGSVIELFIAAPDASNFGQGQTYLASLTEGGASDTDATTGIYTSPLNGQTVGTDTTNKFRFVVAVPAGVSVGSLLTSTATSGGNTSEFGNNITVLRAPAVTLDKTSNAPANAQVLPDSDLTYTINFTNTNVANAAAATGLVINDAIPANTDFKINSVANNLGTTGLTVAVAYSNNNGASYTYTPVSGGGSAPAGYDRALTNIRWTFTGTLSQTPPNNTGSVSFTVRIR